MAEFTYSLIIPVYNESKRLAEALPRLANFATRLGDAMQVIFVDDGSKDTSYRLLRDYSSHFPQITLLRQRPNMGKGWAVRTGMLAATGQYRAFLDVDLATPPEDLCLLFAALDQDRAAIAIGSRIQENGIDLRLVGQKRQPAIRRWLGKIFSLLATRPFLGNIRDSQCGAKAFTATAAQELFPRQQLKRWTFDIELLYLARKLGFRVVEVPVAWEAKTDSKLKPSISLAYDVLRELLQIGWIHRHDGP
jgi:dolichyl-phosphate beta-glucosyltransferase